MVSRNDNIVLENYISSIRIQISMQNASVTRYDNIIYSNQLYKDIYIYMMHK